MERRSALITLAGAVSGLISLPAWANGWSVETTQLNQALLSADQNERLAIVAETIIPATDTPGAKALNVHQFIQKVIVDCADKPSQELFTKGIGVVDELARQSFGKPFGDGDAAQRMAVLTQMSKSDDAAQKGFYNLVKNLTIRGYLNSEYVMTNLTHYEFIPGHYHGCVPVPAKSISQPK